MRRATVALGLIALVLGAARAGEPGAPAGVAPTTSASRALLRGVAITLHEEDPDKDYRPAVAEVADLGASAASVVVNLYQENGASAEPGRHPKRTASDATVLATVRAARARGLAVLVVPVVLLEHPGEKEWRGNVAPPEVEAWFRGYRRELLRLASVAREGGATCFCVGSELSSLERHETRWRLLIDEVRGALPGVALTYGANWDHYDEVPFWDALDLVGLSGYYELAKSEGASDDELRSAWSRVRDRLADWRARRTPGKRLLFTEVGYASQRGCSTKPWNYLLSKTVDLDEQRRCYEAFLDAWRASPDLAGVFFYEWYGEGGPDDATYTPRGKPTEQVLRRWFAERP
jgi:hypothetical protein